MTELQRATRRRHRVNRLRHLLPRSNGHLVRRDERRRASASSWLAPRAAAVSTYLPRRRRRIEPRAGADTRIGECEGRSDRHCCRRAQRPCLRYRLDVDQADRRCSVSSAAKLRGCTAAAPRASESVVTLPLNLWIRASRERGRPADAIVGERVTTAVIGANAWSAAGRLGRPVLSLTAIPATGVVRVPG